MRLYKTVKSKHKDKQVDIQLFNEVHKLYFKSSPVFRKRDQTYGQIRKNYLQTRNGKRQFEANTQSGCGKLCFAASAVSVS